MGPGEIYFADTAFGTRPAIIVSREPLNRGDYVGAVLCTSAHFATRSALPNCVAFRAGEFGFTKDCVAQGETITFLPKADLHLDLGPTGVLTDEAMRDLIRAVGSVLDAVCEPV